MLSHRTEDSSRQETQRQQEGFQEPIKLSEQVFRFIFENAQIGIGIFDIEKARHFSNRALQQMLGYGQEELCRLERWDDMVHPEERDSGAKRYAELVAGKKDADEYTQRFIRHDGQIVTASGRFTLIRDVAGKPSYVVALHEDITERKRAEEAQIRATQQLQLILESTGQGIYGIDLRGNCVFINRATCDMIGYEADQALGHNMHDLVHHHKPDGSPYPVEECPIYRAIREGENCRVDAEVLWRRDGTPLPVEYSSFPIFEAGKITGAVVTVWDITERKAAERLLHKRDEELRRANFLAETALELTRAGYWHVPLDGSGWYNSSPRRMAVFGDFPNPDYRYRIDEVFAHAAEGNAAAAAAARRAFANAVEGRTDTYNTEFAYKRPIDGHIMWVHALGHIVKDADGKPTDMYGVSQDITESKRLEAELLSAKEVAESATKAKSDFLANMSHEIRTPMNAIIGMTHLALRTELTLKQREYLTKTKAAAETLLGIINDILDFSKIEAGKLNMERVEFQLDQVLENLSTVVSQKAYEKNLEFLIDIEHHLPTSLLGDPLRLGQVLINIVNNAVKFTERGEIVVTVRLEERLSDRLKLKFEVRDTGIGMTAEQSARLFQAFSQADTSMSRRYGGTGLGLSISKRLVEMMEGNIWAKSEFGRGTTFWFTAWFGVSSAETRNRVLPGFSGIRALVVDDNALAREILAELLKRFLARVDCVASGEEALRELARADREDPYELVLMDWQMPGLSGLQASRLIKESGFANIPRIVMITAFGREEIRMQAEEIGIDGFLQKPVSPSVLLETLTQIFGVTERSSAGATPARRDRQALDASGIRVLLVEDNEMNQQVATELLESFGAHVTVASHGAEAVKILTRDEQFPRFDVVLMDLQMPEMDGLTATRLLRAETRLQQLPIIAMTAHAMAEEVQRCLEAGMNDHVAKPIDPDAFMVTLMRWVPSRNRKISDSPSSSVDTGEQLNLPEIDGVDVRNGLRRVAGNTALYCDLLRQFAAKHVSAAQQIAAALQNGDRGLAEQLAHSLKGVAGNLGMNSVFASAGGLERAIRDSPSDVPSLVKELSCLLERQARAIQQVLASPGAGESLEAQPASDSSATLAAISRLIRLLETSDADASEAYSTLAQLLKGRILKARLDALGAAVNGFDFDGALVALREIAKEYEASAKHD